MASSYARSRATGKRARSSAIGRQPPATASPVSSSTKRPGGSSTAVPSQAPHEPGHDRDHRLAAGQGHGMVRPRTADREGAVGGIPSEELGAAAAQMEGLPNQPELGKAFVGPRPDRLGGKAPGEIGQEATAQVVVDRPAVVGV